MPRSSFWRSQKRFWKPLHQTGYVCILVCFVYCVHVCFVYMYVLCICVHVMCVCKEFTGSSWITVEDLFTHINTQVYYQRVLGRPTQRHTYLHTHIHMYIHMYICTFTGTNTQVYYKRIIGIWHTQIHLYMHTYIYTYTHIYTQVYYKRVLGRMFGIENVSQRFRWNKCIVAFLADNLAFITHPLCVIEVRVYKYALYMYYMYIHMYTNTHTHTWICMVAFVVDRQTDLSSYTLEMWGVYACVYIQVFTLHTSLHMTLLRCVCVCVCMFVFVFMHNH